jgi:hypothetical protein
MSSSTKRPAVDQATLARYNQLKINFQTNLIPNFPTAEWELLEDKAVTYTVLKCRGIRLKKNIPKGVDNAGKSKYDIKFCCICGR